MTAEWELTSNFLVALVAIVNPIEKIPLWVEASKDIPQRQRWRLAGLIILSSAVVLLFFMWFGRQILTQLHIDLASFKIGGGLILLRFGFSIMNGSAIDIKQGGGDSVGQKTQDVVIERFRQVFIPLGVPVIAGPGAITTVIIYGYQSDSLPTDLMLSASTVAILLVLFFTLMTGHRIQRITGDLPLDLVSRVFGMILIAIAVQFIVDGLSKVFPGWAGPTT